jgi:hypothetical protein
MISSCVKNGTKKGNNGKSMLRHIEYILESELNNKREQLKAYFLQ